MVINVVHLSWARKLTSVNATRAGNFTANALLWICKLMLSADFDIVCAEDKIFHIISNGTFDFGGGRM